MTNHHGWDDGSQGVSAGDQPVGSCVEVMAIAMSLKAPRAYLRTRAAPTAGFGRVSRDGYRPHQNRPMKKPGVGAIG